VGKFVGTKVDTRSKKDARADRAAPVQARDCGHTGADSLKDPLLDDPVQLDEPGTETTVRNNYDKEDRRKAKEGLKITGLGKVASTGSAYVFWNFAPGKADIVGTPDPAVTKVLAAAMKALYRPLTAFRYPNKGEGKSLPFRENPYANPCLGVVALQGITDNVQGYKKETDHGLRVRRALAIKKHLATYLPKGAKLPDFEIQAALPGSYAHSKGGNDANSRAQNRAVFVHVRPKVQELTPEQEKEMIEKDVKKKYREDWPPDQRALTRQRLKGSLPSQFKNDEKLLKKLGDFLVVNYDTVKFRGNQEFPFNLDMPQAGQRTETKADLNDPKKVDDLRVLAKAARQIRDFEIEYGKLGAGSSMYWSAPTSPKERENAIKSNRKKRFSLRSFWRFLKGTSGSYAVNRRAEIKKEFKELLKKFPRYSPPDWYPRDPTKLD